METIEGNKLIAEFMGWKHHEDSSWDAHEMANLKYHSEWNWLMPVVEKIETLGYDTGICGVEIKGEKLSEVIISPIKKENGKIEIHSRTSDNKTNLTWRSVVQFIQWYNTTKPQPNAK